MGRPPCCDKVGIKKGPWTPEEDIILVSYIQEHGPGNWRSVPTNTGLMRCSKSCRLRWTNYLRPGIKRGNFTPHEEGMIIHLQALLGNKWAAIASYLPQRTDNDIKNYWNTHLKKKLKKFQVVTENEDGSSLGRFAGQTSAARNLSNQVSTTYASSTENISRLLEGWMRSSPKSTTTSFLDQDLQNHRTNTDQRNQASYEPIKAEELEGFGAQNSMLSLEKFNVCSWGEGHDQRKFKGNQGFGSDGHQKHMESVEEEKRRKDKDGDDDHDHHHQHHDGDGKDDGDDHAGPPLTFIEKWLLDETSGGQMEEMNQLMELSSML